MEGLIESLLTLSRVTNSEMNREEVDLSKLVGEIVDGMQLAEPERRVVFDIASNVTTHGDSPLLKIVLENLLGNAWKFTKMRDEARIEFGVAEAAGERVYFVRDNGAGFDMKNAANLFKPFQRLHNPANFPGTGVGLATVQRIIQRHGGRVWGEGAVDQGAVLYFTLK
jgi:signal transduction histidine kinase